MYINKIYTQHNIPIQAWGRRGRDRMVVRFTTTYVQLEPITTDVISNPLRAVVQHYVMTFVSGLRQVGGFLRVLLFPPPIKVTATI